MAVQYPLPSDVVRRSSPVALAIVLVLDAALLAWHLMHAVGGSPAAMHWLATSHWSVERDRGIPEIYGYLLLGIAIAGLVYLARRRRQPVLYAWAATFALVLLDDEMMVHERGARIILRLVGAPEHVFGFRAQDLGEMAIWGAEAVLPLLAVVVLHRRAGRAERELSRVIGLLMAALVFFGVVLDQLHSLFWDGIAAAGALEDGGEMVVMSLLAALVIGELRSNRRADVPAGTSEAVGEPALSR